MVGFTIYEFLVRYIAAELSIHAAYKFNVAYNDNADYVAAMQLLLLSLWPGIHWSIHCYVI